MTSTVWQVSGRSVMGMARARGEDEGGVVAKTPSPNKLHPRFFQKFHGRGEAGFEQDDLVDFGHARWECGSFRRQSTA
jgi:hypothetical protein